MPGPFGTKIKPPPPPAEGESRYFLIVVGEAVVYSAALPEQGAVSIGRSDQNVVWIHDPTMSRSHAVLHVDGDHFEIEDLGKQNGTSVSGNALSPNARAPLVPGQIFEMASTMFVISRRVLSSPPRRLWPHGY